MIIYKICTLLYRFELKITSEVCYVFTDVFQNVRKIAMLHIRSQIRRFFAPMLMNFSRNLAKCVHISNQKKVPIEKNTAARKNGPKVAYTTTSSVANDGELPLSVTCAATVQVWREQASNPWG